MLNEFDILRARFAPDDAVAFAYRGSRQEGRIIRTNPKRAVVEVSGKETYQVPYSCLKGRADIGQAREKRIRNIHRQALLLLHEHGLKQWTFRFDHSTRRAGCCSYHDKRISISFALACNASEADVRDTMLHEIAHALVGKEHNHDAVWKARAREIGCSGERCHRLHFSPPRYTVTCENRCWSYTAERRNARLICRNCGGTLVYTPYPAVGEPAASIG